MNLRSGGAGAPVVFGIGRAVFACERPHGVGSVHRSGHSMAEILERTMDPRVARVRNVRHYPDGQPGLPIRTPGRPSRRRADL
jgi:hypothetical protein